MDIGKKSRLRIRADELDLETSKHCNFAVTGEEIRGFLKGRDGRADKPATFHDKLQGNTRHQYSYARLSLEHEELKTNISQNYIRYSQNWKAKDTKLEKRNHN